GAGARADAAAGLGNALRSAGRRRHAAGRQAGPGAAAARGRAGRGGARRVRVRRRRRARHHRRARRRHARLRSALGLPPGRRRPAHLAGRRGARGAAATARRLAGVSMGAGVAEGPDSFLDKWRARWPEWTLAEVFVPAPQREAVVAWLALRQELLDAAWGGSDPRPGEAKLGWWQEELEAWQRGMRRHPLGKLLQPREAPWAMLAAALPLLAATREQPAPARLRPFAEALAAVGAALEPRWAPAAMLAAAVPRRAATRERPAPARLRPCAEALAAVGAALEPGSVAVPWDTLADGLRAQRLLGGADDAVHRQEAAALAAGWHTGGLDARGRPLAGRLFDAILHARLARHARGAHGPPARMRTLFAAWRAARKT